MLGQRAQEMVNVVETVQMVVGKSLGLWKVLSSSDQKQRMTLAALLRSHSQQLPLSILEKKGYTVYTFTLHIFIIL